MTPWGELLDGLRGNLSWSDLAANLEYDRGNLRHMVDGPRPVPEPLIAPWADRLELTGPERDRFVLMAYLTQLPLDVQEKMASIQRDLDTLRARIKRLEDRP